MNLEFQNIGNYGVYLHSTVDRRLGNEGEAVLLPWLQGSLIVDMDGNRVGNEENAQGFQLVDALVQSPGQKLWGISASLLVETEAGINLVFDRALEDEPEILSYDEMVETSMFLEAADISTLASLAGIDAIGLEATLSRYEELVQAGKDTDHGKRTEYLRSLGLGPYVASELMPGPAKAFVGVELDLEGRVLDRLGVPIPGLMAAGEAAGMLGSSAVGDGFTGSATAVVLTGLVAGRTAAERAQASP
jgi:fumarate reductase flavoprotein subunit